MFLLSSLIYTIIAYMLTFMLGPLSCMRRILATAPLTIFLYE